MKKIEIKKVYVCNDEELQAELQIITDDGGRIISVKEEHDNWYKVIIEYDK